MLVPLLSKGADLACRAWKATAVETTNRGGFFGNVKAFAQILGKDFAAVLGNCMSPIVQAVDLTKGAMKNMGVAIGQTLGGGNPRQPTAPPSMRRGGLAPSC